MGRSELGLLFTRCDDGDYIIDAAGERVATIQSVPSLNASERSAFTITSADSVATYRSESARGARFMQWSEGAPERGHFVPYVSEDIWVSPSIGPGASLAIGGSGDDITSRIYDTRSGAWTETCGEERRLTFSPTPRHILVSCPDATTYVNVATGAEEAIPTDEPFDATFSRDATRLLRFPTTRDPSYEVYDRASRTWIDSWADISSVQWFYPTNE